MNIEMIRAAQQRLSGHARVTPLLSSPFLDDIAGRQVFVKAECLQHTGSFKYRGAWSAISALSDDIRKNGILAFSSGNHAQGVALAAKQHGVSATIIMPKDAPAIKISNTRALGADVVLYDRISESRDDIGNALARDRGLTLIKPFDDADVIAGQASVGLEIAEQAAGYGVIEAEVLACCGGGGLTSGIALALEADAPKMIVRPVEPKDFDDVTRSLKQGKILANETPAKGICDAVLTPQPGDMTFPILKRLCGDGIVVSEDDCLRAMALAFERLKIVIEPGGAVALAAALFHGKELQSDTVIATASGGNVDTDMFQRALRTKG